MQQAIRSRINNIRALVSAFTVATIIFAGGALTTLTARLLA